MPRLRWLLPGLLLVSAAGAQPNSSEIEIANLREDVRGLAQRVSELTLRVEQLEADNTHLKERAGARAEGAVTLVQLNQAIADLTRTLDTAVAAAKADTLRQVAQEMQRGPRPAANGSASGFSDNFPKEGENYSVQRGDTIASIAKKTGAKVQDIINANKLADPAHIRAGQNLFIPGGK